MSSTSPVEVSIHAVVPVSTVISGSAALAIPVRIRLTANAHFEIFLSIISIPVLGRTYVYRPDVNFCTVCR